MSLFSPRATGETWTCDYEIEWPGTTRRASVGAADGAQAVLLALQAIGAELYCARPHDVVDLYWLEPGGGVGFPLPPSLRDLAIDEDRLIWP